MSLSIAVDRLYETGWLPAPGDDVETLADGRSVPSVLAIQRVFTAAGLELTIKHNLIFDCYRAEWSDQSGAAGTVVGQTELEAAVFALAQLRAVACDPDLIQAA
jgi:hypothetical protein